MSVIANTGSTAHFFQDFPVTNRHVTTSPLAIRNPNGSIMCSTHEADVDIPNLAKAARTVHIVPDLASHSPLSIGQLCDAGCVVEFAAANVTLQHNNSVVLHGHRTPATQLWHVDLPNEAPIAELPSEAPIAESNAAVGSATPSELVSFAHASLWSPVLSTLATALDKNYVTNFPGLSSCAFRNHPPHSAATIKGHLDQSRKNQRSTKTSFTLIEPNTAPEDLETFPPAPVDGARSHSCFVSTVEITGQTCTDQTGKFITPCSTGNNYLLVLYDYDSNANPSRTHEVSPRNRDSKCQQDNARPTVQSWSSPTAPTPQQRMLCHSKGLHA
jgi:hypothetical protein